MKDFTLANFNFAVELFKKQQQDSSGKNFISFSVGSTMALGMLLLGSSKATADEIRKALHFWRGPETVTPTDGPHSGTECDVPGGFHSRFKQILTILNQHSKYHMLKIGGRIYGSKAEDFLEHYKKCVKEIYNSDFEKVDFMNAPEEARQKINFWIESETNGVIKDFFPPDSIDPSTFLILLSTTSFQGRWKFPFNPRNTYRGVFWNCQDQSIYVDMMTQRGRFNTANISNPSMKVVQLPYVDDILSMYIFLPDNRLSTDQIITNLTLEQLQRWIGPANMRKADLKICLPKFKVEMNHSMNSAFSKMGVKDLFTSGKADLSGMTGNTQSMVSQISQSIFFAVNEEGVEAAGASRTEVVDGTYNEIKVDKEFIFMVKHTATGLILFLGRICMPKWKELP
ncbi:serpin B3-like [Pituophis catenifer annectens]|uniref:serpin B3-like n=1 Tax=Pituophis catenifer annectens TaxID=94852 RepID=UPI00399624A2